MKRGSDTLAEPAGRNVNRVVRGYPVRVLVAVIELYRHMVSPLRLPTCRFTPTCSQYAVEALTEYGLIRGSYLATLRLGKCGPWHRGGWDPIPGRDGDGAERRDTNDAGGISVERGESESFV